MNPLAYLLLTLMVIALISLVVVVTSVWLGFHEFRRRQHATHTVAEEGRSNDKIGLTLR